MYAMQYVVPLPADYDMQVIRHRVESTGSRFDGFPGLKFKAFLIREKIHGAPGNEYAPFYVWNDVDGMRTFCWGESGYSNIVRDFGRRPIQDWTVIRVIDGHGDPDDALSATIHTQALPDGAPSELIPKLTGEFVDGADETTCWRVAAVDVTTWTLLLAEISTKAVKGPVAPGDAVYEVLHVSRA